MFFLWLTTSFCGQVAWQGQEEEEYGACHWRAEVWIRKFSWNLGKLICWFVDCQDYWEEGTEGRESGSKSKRPNSTKEFNNNCCCLLLEKESFSFRQVKSQTERRTVVGRARGFSLCTFQTPGFGLVTFGSLYEARRKARLQEKVPPC